MPTNNADFTPTIDNSAISPSIGAYKVTGSFRFWVQKVLPLVYDDSLSYYELLCKVVNYLNDVIENVDTLNDNVNSINESFSGLQNYVNATKDELISTYNELQSYVNNYFASLDIQDEINNKLDAMASDGSLIKIISPIVPNIVTDWLHDNVTPTSPIVDATLSISGAAADAKVAGDKITELKNDLTKTWLSGNLIPYDYYSGDTLEHNGITFTKNTDSTVSSVGTATGQARYYWIGPKGIEIPAGIYKLSGIPSDAGNRSFGLQYAVGNGDFAATDYITVYSDTDITITDGQKVSIRTWYYNGYVDSGHTWSICLGSAFGSLNNDYNPYTFVPIIYENQQSAKLIEQANNRLNALETLEYADYLSDSFELGSFTTGGRPVESTTTVRTVEYISKPSEPLPVKVMSGYRAYIHYYDTNESIANMATSGWLYPDSSYSILTTYNFYRYVVQKVPLAESVPQDEILTYGHSLYHDISTPIVDSVLTLTDDATELNNRTSALEDDTTDLDNRVTALEEGSSQVADYWQTYLTSIEADLKNAIYDTGNHGDSFYFFTDYHFDKNADSLTGGEQLYKVIQWLTDKIPVRKIVNGGDILQTHATVDAALEELNIFYRNFHKFAPTMYNVIGNHDSNHYKADARLTDGQMYQDLFAGFNLNTAAHLQQDMYYYFDNDTQKMRYIILNTKGNYATFSADSAQLQWIIDTLNDAPVGYNIVVIPHWFFEVNAEDSTVTQLSNFGTLIKSLLDAYNGHTNGTWSGLSYDFSNAGGKVIAVITGHVHREYSEISAAGYPMIGFICDAVNGSAQLTTRTIGTYTEHSVSLITINTTAKTIVCTPIGAGTSRTFSYT